jgi:hypothetical protein
MIMYKIATMLACLAVGSGMMDRAAAPFSIFTVAAALSFVSAGAIIGAYLRARLGGLLASPR